MSENQFLISYYIVCDSIHNCKKAYCSLKNKHQHIISVFNNNISYYVLTYYIHIQYACNMYVYNSITLDNY